MVDPVQIAAFGTLISATTLILTLYFRRRDRQSRVKVHYYVGGDSPPQWLADADTSITAGLSPPSYMDPVLWFRVENVGERDESLSDAYIELPSPDPDYPDYHPVLYPYDRKTSRLPRTLQPRFPLVFGEQLVWVSRELVQYGFTGTVRLDFFVRLGSGKLYKKRIEIPDVEDKANG